MNDIQSIDLKVNSNTRLPKDKENGGYLSFESSLNGVVAILNEAGKTETIVEQILNNNEMLVFCSNQMSVFSGNLKSKVVQLSLTETIGDQLLNILSFKDRRVQDTTAKTMQLLEVVGFVDVEEVLYQKPIHMSYEEQKLLMIVFAIAAEAKLFLIDEPKGTQEILLGTLLELKEMLNLTILFVTNDLSWLAENSDRVLVFYEGELIEDTDVETFFTNPKHPYTSNLINSLSSYKNKIDALGRLGRKSVNNFSNGCRYVECCNHKIVRCTENHPNLFEVEMAHYVRCYLYEGS